MQTTIDLSTLLVVRELQSGECLIFPIADPDLCSHGGEAACLLEQRLFLEQYLSAAPPEVLARFSLPAGTELREVDVIVPRSDLPRRLKVDTALAIPCIVIGRWVMVLPLRHTFHLEPKDDLDEAVRAEVVRMVGAEELTATDYLALLPGRAHRLERLDLTIERVERLPPGRAGSLRRKLAERQKRKAARAVLETVARPLHAARAPAPPVVGRETELALLSTLLGGKERLSVLLVGPESAGKGALLQAWTDAEAARSGREVWATSEAQLIAGMSGLGQWQERIRRVLEAAESIDAILSFDTLEDLFAERSLGVDFLGAIKPFLDERRVRIVGELRDGALDRLQGRSPGFFACLSRVAVGPLGVADTRRALAARIAHAARHEPSRPNLLPDAVQPLLDLADRYLPYRAFPGKAMRLFDELRAVHDAERDASGTPVAIGPAQVYGLFSLQTGIPELLVREERALRVEDVVAALRRRMIGQDEAVRRVAEAVCVVKAGLQPPGKPLATLLFVGPTGVGKTELARSLAAYLFGSEDRLVRFDMSEFMDARAAERLIRGLGDSSGRAEGLLTKKIREQPFSVLLLDEIEKAHPAVFDLLLQVAGEGRLTDAAGRVAYFENAIIIMTSNLGAAHRHETSGFLAAGEADASHYLRHVERAFRPEFVNRLDRILTFRPLDEAEMREVARVALARVIERRGLGELGVHLEVDATALDRLAREGFSPIYGARALRRHLEDRLVAPVARLLAGRGKAARGGTVRVGADLVPELIPPPTKDKVVRVGLPAIGRDRRHIDHALERDRAREVKEQIEYLVAQLSYGEDARRPSREQAALLAEHQRLTDLWSPAEATQREVWGIEELALPAHFDGEDVRPLAHEAERLRTRFAGEAVRVILALEKRRDAVTLLCQEIDDGRALDRWLAPLLRDLRRRGWTANVHVEGMAAGTGETWHKSRRFGPPRSAEWALELLASPARAWKSVILRVSGPFAGVLLALEGGLHRFAGVGDVKPCLLVTRVALRTELTEEEWEGTVLSPLPPKALKDVPMNLAVRDYVTWPQWLRLAGGRASLAVAEGDYWARFEEIAWLHLLGAEETWDEQFRGRLD